MSYTRRQLEQLLAQLEASVARAFLQAVAKIKSAAKIAELEAAIEANDVEAAFRAVGMRAFSWVAVQEAVRSAYIAGGQFVAMHDVPSKYGFAFDVRTSRAERWLSEHAARMAVELNERQRDAIRTTMAAGMQQGRGPRSIALDIAGRMGRTGRRTGGIIGLHEQFAEFVGNARQDLEALSPNYFTRARRDRRFDGIVQRAIDSSKSLPASTIDQLVSRYADRLLSTRGENLARTEALASMNAASDEALRQVVDDGLAPPDAIEKVWDATGDARTRESHMAANEQRRNLDQPFSVNGYAMMHPGDPNAPASEIINCRCWVRHEIDFSRTA